MRPVVHGLLVVPPQLRVLFLNREGVKHPLVATEPRTVGHGELQTASTCINPVTSVTFVSAVLCGDLTVCSGMMDV